MIIKKFNILISPIPRFIIIAAALIFVTTMALFYGGSTRVGAASNLSVTNASLLFTEGQNIDLAVQSIDALQWKLQNSLDQDVATGTLAAGSSGINLGNKIAKGMYKVTFTSSSQTNTVRFMVLSTKSLTNDPYYMVQTHYGQSTKLVYNVDRSISLLKQVGFNGIRDEVTWSRVETTLGQYNTPAYARDYMNKASANNMSMLWIADYSNTRYGSSTYDIGDPQTIAGFANYVHAFLDMNRDIKMVEVWNEYDGNALPCKTGTCYVELLKAVYERVKPDFPNVQIIGGATTANASDNNWQWFRQLFDAGGMSYLDALSIHPYRKSNNDMKTTANSLNDIVRSYNNGQTKPLLISEFGVPISSNLSETRQAARIVSSLVQYKSIPNVQTVSIYDSIDDGEDPSDSQHNYGMFKGSSDFQSTRVATAYEPKPSVQAFYTLRQQTDGLEFMSESPVITDTINRFDFGSGGSVKKSAFVHMKYASGGGTLPTETYSITVDPSKVTLIQDMYGNTIQRSEGTPTLQLTQNDGPLYVGYLEENQDMPGMPNTGFDRMLALPILIGIAVIALVLFSLGHKRLKRN